MIRSQMRDDDGTAEGELQDILDQFQGDIDGSIDWDSFFAMSGVNHQRCIYVNGQHVILYTREQLDKKAQPALRTAGLNLAAALNMNAVMPRHSHTLIEFIMEMQGIALKQKDPVKKIVREYELQPRKLYLGWRKDCPQTGTYEKVEGRLHSGLPVWKHVYNEHYGRAFPFVMYMGKDDRWRIVDEDLNPELPDFLTPVFEVSSGKVMMMQPVKKSLETALAAEGTMRQDDDPVCPADVKFWITTRTRGINESPFDRKAGYDWVSNRAVEVTRDYKKPFGSDEHYRMAINQRSG